MGAIAFQKGLGMTHSCAHALSTLLDLHHGYANGLMINHTLRFNLPSVPERFQEIARILKLSNRNEMGVIEWLTQLKSQLQIPQRLSEAAVRREQIESLAELALQDGCHFNNPRECKKEDFIRVFQEAY
jgi:alcohol dehydrogenase class IV